MNAEDNHLDTSNDDALNNPYLAPSSKTAFKAIDTEPLVDMSAMRGVQRGLNISYGGTILMILVIAMGIFALVYFYLTNASDDFRLLDEASAEYFQVVLLVMFIAFWGGVAIVLIGQVFCLTVPDRLAMSLVAIALPMQTLGAAYMFFQRLAQEPDSQDPSWLLIVLGFAAPFLCVVGFVLLNMFLMRVGKLIGKPKLRRWAWATIVTSSAIIPALIVTAIISISGTIRVEVPFAISFLLCIAVPCLFATSVRKVVLSISRQMMAYRPESSNTSP